MCWTIVSAKHLFATIPTFRRNNFYFSLKDLDVAIERLNPDIGFGNVHTSHIKDSKLIRPTVKIAL